MAENAKPRGRRPGNSGTRAAIMQAALALFSRNGYDKVSLRAVAREADVDPALIHHYFDSKAELFSRSVLDGDLRPAAIL
ncbi:MAG: helix-turn-helix transcriptional regulator, partial [Propionibacteriaceae bacterium]|nr:helix-turn-helix transcriptional regulator [Propionibacteriaceae bacterium]